MPNVQHKRGTRSALTTLEGSSGPLPGQIHLITDEARPAIATAVDESESSVVSDDVFRIVVLTQAAYDALTPISTTLYVIDG